MQKATSHFSFIIFVLLFSIAGFGQDKTSATANTAVATNPKAPEITFEKTTHDFGTVKKGTPVVYKFKYKNTGKEPLIIFDCRAGCGCTTPKCSKEPLKPGKTGFIEVHYDSMRVGHFGKEIMIKSNAKNGVVTLVIKGVIQAETEGSDGMPAKKEEHPLIPAQNKKE